jgi:hypothetical protein
MFDNSGNMPLVFAATLSLFCTSLSASTLSVRDWKNVGDGALTYDSSTNLEWLDLTQTVGQSVPYVDSQLGPGGAYEGFRYATDAEVNQLFDNFGLFSYSSLDEQVAKIDDMTAFIGQTYNYQFAPSGGFRGFAGANDPGLIHRGMWVMNMWYYQDGCCAGVTWWVVEDFGYEPGFLPDSYIYEVGDGTGSFLVQAAIVPLPAAIWLLGAGLLGLVGIARKP